jgi:hypothetical protein
MENFRTGIDTFAVYAASSMKRSTMELSRRNSGFLPTSLAFSAPFLRFSFVRCEPRSLAPLTMDLAGSQNLALLGVEIVIVVREALTPSR